jgi:hypothetical protein
MLQIWWFKVCFVVEQWYDNTGCVGLNEKKNEIVQVEINEAKRTSRRGFLL